MPKKGELKRQTYFAQCSRAIQSLTGVSGEFCICPLCGEYFTRKDLEVRLSIEHVPPECLGGKELLLTCRNCNTFAGHTLDSTLHQRQRFQDFMSAPSKCAGARKERIKLRMGGESLNFELHRSNGNYSFMPAGNDPLAFSRWKSWMERCSKENLWDGQEFNVSLLQGFNKELAEVADLRIAYLLAFAAFGYRYALDERLDLVRQQLTNPRKRIIKGFHSFLGWRISKEPSLLIASEPVGALVICLGTSVVLLPWLDGPLNPYDFLFDRFGTTEKIHFAGKKGNLPNQLSLCLDFLKRS